MVGILSSRSGSRFWDAEVGMHLVGGVVEGGEWDCGMCEEIEGRVCIYPFLSSNLSFSSFFLMFSF